MTENPSEITQNPSEGSQNNDSADQNANGIHLGRAASHLDPQAPTFVPGIRSPVLRLAFACAEFTVDFQLYASARSLARIGSSCCFLAVLTLEIFLEPAASSRARALFGCWTEHLSDKHPTESYSSRVKS